jgi:hypothetical protein
MAIPGTEDERLVSTPVEFPTLFEVWVEACSILVRKGFFYDVPEWHVAAVEDDGSERDLTTVEIAALAAQWEQAFGGAKGGFVPVDKEPD